MKATDRHKARVNDLLSSPMDGEQVVGDTSDDVKQYGGMASGALMELVSSQLKKKEDAKKAEAFKNSEAGKAQAVAQEAQKRAAMDQAEALAETDFDGPRHKKAAASAAAAQVAAAKAQYLMAQLPGGAPAGTALAPGGMPGYPAVEPPSFFEQHKTAFMIGGAVLGLGLVVAIVRRS